MSLNTISNIGVNIQEKATVIWNVADMLRGPFKPHEYGLVILPMTVVKRFNDCLMPTYNEVQETYQNVKHLAVIDGFLTTASGYQFYNMQLVAREHGWAQFQTMENHYNLLYREDERELIPICKQMHVSLMPYSPLAAGHLTRPEWEGQTLRGRTDRVAMGKYDDSQVNDMKIVERVHELAQKYNVKMQQIALAWEWAKGVASPIVGATKARYLDDAVYALDVHLSPEDIAYLEEPYVPHRIVGAIDHNPPQGVLLLDKK